MLERAAFVLLPPRIYKRKFFRMHPFLIEWVRVQLCDSTHTCTMQVNSGLASPALKRQKAPSQMTVSAGHVPALTRKWAGCVTAGSVGGCDSITAFDTCNGSHLFFLREYWKKKKRLPSCNQKLLLSQHLACPPFMSSSFILKLILYFWYIVAQRVNGLCQNMLPDGWYTDFFSLIKYLPGGITAKQSLKLEILPTCFCVLPAPEWPGWTTPKKEGCCCKKRLHNLPVQWNKFSSCCKSQAKQDSGILARGERWLESSTEFAN